VTVTDGAPLLDIQGVGRSYRVSDGWFSRRTIEAVRSVDLTLAADEVVALVGESGSGKTTLGRMTVGLVEPSHGVIRHNGVELSGRSGRQMREFRSKASIVFQNPYQSLNPRMRVDSALGEVLQVSGVVPKEKISAEIDRLLTSVNLSTSYRTKFPLALSGGERQRIAIARAIAGRPDFLVADEVTSALDVSVSAQILNLLLELKAERTFTCLFITHDLALAMVVADRIAIMRHGEVVDSGTPGDLMASSQNQYTRELLDLVTLSPAETEDLTIVKEPENE
jgi:ABC-type glutathione transport system ATPase component